MSSVVSRQRERTRVELLDAAVRVILSGREPTMRSIAAEAQVGERTIYRYFENAESCASEVRAHIAPRLGVPLCERSEDLDDYARRLYGTFEANHALAVSFLRSSWAAAELENSRRANLDAMHELLAKDHPQADPVTVQRAAAALRTVLSGSGWLYQRVSCGLEQAEVVENARWLVRSTLAALS